MKRILVLALALIVALGSLAVPSYAAESPWLEVLDYDSFNEYGNFFQFTTSASISYDLPFAMSLQYVDILAYISGSVPTSIQAKWDGGNDSSELIIVPLGNKLYRIYGYIPSYTYYSVGLSFTSPGTTYCTLLSFKVSSSALSGFDVPVSAYLFADGDWIDFSFSGSGEAASASIPISSSVSSWSYSAGINIAAWQNYDFIDIAFSVYGAASINSLSAMFDSADGDQIGGYLDISYSYISESFYNDGNYEVVVRIDLSSVDRTSDNALVLRIDGEHNGEEISFYISDVTGYVVPSYTDPDVHFLQKIWNSITSGFSSVGSWISNQTSSFVSSINSLISNINTWAFDVDGHGLAWLLAQIRFKLISMYDDFSGFFQQIITLLEGKDADDMQQDVQDQVDEFNDMQGVIDSVTVPDVDNIDTDISHVVSTDQINAVTGVYGSIFGISFISDFVALTSVLGLASFLIYGKKG